MADGSTRAAVKATTVATVEETRRRVEMTLAEEELMAMATGWRDEVLPLGRLGRVAAAWLDKILPLAHGRLAGPLGRGGAKVAGVRASSASLRLCNEKSTCVACHRASPMGCLRASLSATGSVGLRRAVTPSNGRLLF